jgi:peptide/nickel transport system substrate-binding protein
MQQQVYEPLFMYDKLSTDAFIALVADYWPGYGVGSNWITPSAPDPTAPPGTHETWYFHIRPNNPWQNPTYGNVKPRDVWYSILRGILQDSGTGVQWMTTTALLGAGGMTLDPMFDRDENGVINATEWVNYLKPAVMGCMGYNATYVWFNLPASYAPFMQILTQAWCFVLSEDWCIAHDCIDLDVAFGAEPAGYNEFFAHWQPSSSPLMDSALINSAEPMMGSGPYKLVSYNSDPHVGFQVFQQFTSYWGGWVGSHATSATIKVVEEWANRKAQFFSTDPGLQVDFADVPMANCPEMHVGGDKDAATLPGFRLTKYFPQTVGAVFFCYNVSSPSDYMPKVGGVDEPLLFRDRDMRLAFMYCLNITAYMHDYWLGEAVQPTTVMAVGTAYYNASKPTYSIDLAKATQHFQAAMGGKIWSQGFSVKLVYNTGNLARQTALSMIANIIMTRIPWPVGVTVDVTANSAPWSVILPAMEDHALPQFCIGWLADYPDPADWFGPFMDPYGTYSGISQVIEYGIDPSTMNWAPHANYGEPPYVNALGETVTEINNTYIHHIIMTALGAADNIRRALYNEMMDIYYAEAPGEAIYQATARHYERDWIQGWVGGYSNNPIAVGHYFYELYKATVLPDIAVDMSATATLTNTTYVPPIVLNNGSNSMLDWKTNLPVSITYSIHVARLDTTGPVIYAYVDLFATNIWPLSSSPRQSLFFAVLTFAPSGSYSTTVTIPLPNLDNGIWIVSLRTDPIGAAGGQVFDSDPTNNQQNSPYLIKSINDDGTSVPCYVVGDLGSGVPPKFELFDQKVDGKDLSLFLRAYSKEPTSAPTWYLADLGGGVPPTWFKYDGKVDGKDLSLFLLAYHNDPSVPDP